MWASELDPGFIKSIQSFTFDERGRMWAVETFDYPNTVTGPFAGHDRIVILEDTDGDHVVDKQKVFVTGLNIPGGIEVTPQGIVIAMSPHVVLFEDLNGDDVADAVQGKILYTGFRHRDTHMTITNVRYGLDNWLYMGCGYDGGKVGTVSFESGTLRMRMDGSKFEYFSKQLGGGNSAAFGTMEDGQIFSAAATTPCMSSFPVCRPMKFPPMAIVSFQSPGTLSQVMSTSGRALRQPLAMRFIRHDFSQRNIGTEPVS
jgi:putative membrane-bound dehydrogenase-like protein